MTLAEQLEGMRYEAGGVGATLLLVLVDQNEMMLNVECGMQAGGVSEEVLE